MRRLGLLALGAVVGACSEAPRPPDPRLWTVFDVQALYAGGADGAATIANGAGLPGGLPLGSVLAADPNTGTLTLPVRDTVDVYPAAYVTTEVWANYDRVWLQPMYVLVTVGTDGQRTAVTGPDAKVHPIFSVGPRSGFYSPFWQTIYVEVPDGTQPESLSSVRQIIDSGYPLLEGPGRTVSLVPDGVTVDPNGTPISPTIMSKAGEGWLDGAPAPFVDFGTHTFTWDENGVITETPLYHFVFTGSDGVSNRLGVPTVLAAGPPGADAVVPFVDGRYRYPSYWRLYTVALPSAARVFAPPTVTDAVLPGLRDRLTALGFPNDDTAYSPDVATNSEVPSYLGHVAIDPSCFSMTPLDLEVCKWLDTQANIERYIDPSAVAPTNVTVTCPLVNVNHLPVTPGPW